MSKITTFRERSGYAMLKETWRADWGRWQHCDLKAKRGSPNSQNRFTSEGSKDPGDNFPCVDLDGNVKELVSRMKRMAYRPGPVRRVLIPKDDQAGARDVHRINLKGESMRKPRSSLTQVTRLD